MLKAVVFDFDGVIIDTESVWFHIYRDWLKREYQYDLKIQDYLVCVGSHSSELFKFLKKDIGEYVDGYAYEQQAMEEYIQRISVLPAMDGVPEFIRTAHERGLKLAIATSATEKKPRIHLERLGLLSYFDAFSTAEQNKRLKPYPDIFLKAAELLGVKPEECLAVEDSGNGLEAAKRANMPCLVVPNEVTRYCDFEGYYRMADSLSQVSLDGIIEDFQQEKGG